uniref:60S ribosomal export protein NMD3 n=1 Tax=Glossina brevipalpis TaxID=37001 RepID=A0A1A9WFW7_9MUSC
MEYVDFSAKISPNKNAQTFCYKTTGKILCCGCGVSIEPNVKNMCSICLHEHVDITANIIKKAVLNYCRKCERYLQPPGEWIKATLNSPELMNLCLKKVRGLKDLKVLCADFLWTEPHSRRVKIDLKVCCETGEYVGLKQGTIIEYTIQYQMCPECHRVEAKDYWRCVVQVRQHAENRKTYFYLEQLILKHRAHDHTLGIKSIHGGLDFYFSNEQHARKFVNFLEAMVPIKITFSKRLIKHDHNNNVHYYKYTWSVEIAPLSKDSLVCLTNKLRHQLGNMPAICLVHKVSSCAHLIDPLSGQQAELDANHFFRCPFEAICNPRQLLEYIVMDIELIRLPRKRECSSTQRIFDVWLIKATQLGLNEHTVHTRTHIGHLLNVGDSVMAYSLKDININEREFEKLSVEQVPDIIIVRKCFDKSTGSKPRRWKLKYLTFEPMNEEMTKEKQEFLDDIEQDMDVYKSINVYSNTSGRLQIMEENNNDNVFTNAVDDDIALPHVHLEESICNLSLNVHSNETNS